MLFTGSYEHSIDPKHRLAIPADVRALIEREEDRVADETLRLYVTVVDGRTLAIYTRKVFESLAKELDRSAMEPKRLVAYQRVVLSLTRLMEVDKQGRILLPENLLKLSGLGQDVVLIGVGNHLEIRDRKAWQEHLERMLAQEDEVLMNPREALGQKPLPAPES